MAGDPLYDALGQEPPRKPARSPGVAWIMVVLVVLGAAGSGILAMRSRGNGREGDTVAIARIEPAPAPHPAPPPPPAPPSAAPPAVIDPVAPGVVVQPNGDTVEYQNGVKIIRLNPAAVSSTIAVPVPDASGIGLQPAPDPRLIEPSRFGDLPRISPNGLRPSDAYARPLAMAPPGKIGQPQVALLITGGADRAALARAAKRLPPAVSFALAADGRDLQGRVAAVREAGHEVLLQFTQAADASSNAPPATPGTASPGPLDELHRQMGRFTGYAGVTGDLGGATNAATARTMLQDIASRGLFFVQDRTGPADDLRRSAGRLGLQFARADVVVDAGVDKATLKAAMSRLADIARAGGSAIAYVDASAGAVDGLLSAVADLGGAGLVLVPVSTLAGTVPTQSSTAASP